MQALNFAKSALLRLMKEAQKENLTSFEIIDRRNKIINDLCSNVKIKKHVEFASNYFSGMFDLIESETVFFYNYEGVLYCTRNSKELGFEHHSVLAEKLNNDEYWKDDLFSMSGGMYYKNGKPFCNKAVAQVEKFSK